MRRRDFILPTVPVSEPQKQEVKPLLVISRKAMGGEFEISFSNDDFPLGTAAALDALDEVERLEKQFSVFIPESRISFVNKVAAYEPVKLTDELFELIRFAVKTSEETNGAVDITSTPLWRLWRFDCRDPRVPSESEIADALDHVGYKYVELDETEKTVRFAKPGVEISLGCVGKGYALDAAGRIMSDNGVTDFIIHGDLSSVLACGYSPGTMNVKNGWPVGIAHPMLPGERLTEINLCNQSLGTSGSQKQFFRHKGRRFSHILDPRTGYPAEKNLLVTVIADTAVEADILSTAFFVMDAEQIERYCRSHPRISVFVVTAIDESPGYKVVYAPKNV